MSENSRTKAVKTICWTLVGVLVTVTFARFLFGLGASTSLSDAAPWGLWVAFDIMAGVALTAGGFVISALAYVFKLNAFKPFVRPAILTAFLGYVAEIVGLVFDLGLPWRIWHPIVYPQPHSMLFTVAFCAMLYLPLLFLEWSPAILEHPRFDTRFFRSVRDFIEKYAVFFVIAGVMISTLHQSALGSLFLIAPMRLHPLWYTPHIWILFLISAVALGCITVIVEAFFSAWLLNHRVKINPLIRLGKVAAWTLILYAVLRFGDLGIRGDLHLATEDTPMSMLFWAEMLLSSTLPVVLFFIPKVRNSPSGLLIASIAGIFGIVGNRFNVCIVAFLRPVGVSYFPTFSEAAVSVGITAACLLLFIFFAERLHIFEENSEPRNETLPPEVFYHPSRIQLLLPPSMAEPRRYSLAVIAGAAFALGMLEGTPIFGRDTVDTKVTSPMETTAIVDAVPTAERTVRYTVVPNPTAQQEAEYTAKAQPVMLIDGNRNGRMVPFPHEHLKEVLGGKRSCPICHHASLPFKINGTCSACHRDMYLETDLFNHSFHIDRLKGNAGCVRCHPNSKAAKTRASAEKCETCHEKMWVKGSRVKTSEMRMTGMASGYMDAMHGLCVKCHEKKHEEEPARFDASFKSCRYCHRDLSKQELRRTAPYPLEEQTHDEKP